jgi:hypothetical protein
MALLTALFALLAVFQLKHFLADYPLQNRYMLGKFSKDPFVWVPALSAHAGVHALGTALIASWAYFFAAVQHSNTGTWARILLLAAVDFVAHFVMDRIKADPDLLGRFKSVSAQDYQSFVRMAAGEDSDHPEIANAARQAKERLRSNTFFWWALGLDQMWHHLTHYAIIFFLVTHV